MLWEGCLPFGASTGHQTFRKARAESKAQVEMMMKITNMNFRDGHLIHAHFHNLTVHFNGEAAAAHTMPASYNCLH